MHTIHRIVCHEVSINGARYLRLDSDGEEKWYIYIRSGNLHAEGFKLSEELEAWFQEHAD